MRTITLIFWQNCISPHQLPYIKELHKDNRVDKVYLIAPVSISAERKLMGWRDANNIDGVEIIISPAKPEVERLFQENQQNSVHLFSGIRADQSVYAYFKESLNYKVKRGIITEPPYTYDKPLWMHYLRFWLQDRKFMPKIDYVFAIGEDAVLYYRSLSKRWKVVPFIYCTEEIKENIIDNTDKISSELVNLVYVGSLSKRKNVLSLLQALSKLPNLENIRLEIVGNGSEEVTLKQYAETSNLSAQVCFRGALPMSEVQTVLADKDILILPSLYDGWGAVVNEALTNGLYVICSDKCGAKDLLQSDDLGRVYKTNSVIDLKNILNISIQEIDQIRKNREYRRIWSKHISGKEIANYFINNIFSKENIARPWFEK